MGGGHKGGRKVREHPQILQTIAETEQGRENQILVISITKGLKYYLVQVAAERLSF